MYGKQALASHTSDHAIHLYNSRFWMISQILLKVGVVSSNATPSVHLELRLFITGTVFDFTWKINVPDIKKLSINIVIQCLLTAHQLINMIQIDLMKRLPVFDQRTDNPIDSGYIIFV